MNIGIAGFGCVGQAVYASLVYPSANVPCVIYDKYKQRYEGNFVDLMQTDIIFSCLPAAMSSCGSQDFTEYEEFLHRLVSRKYDGIVVIKSTVLYDNLSPYFNDLNLVINPEFLCHNTSIEDFKNQSVIVLGGDTRLALQVKNAYVNRFDIKKYVEFLLCTAREAIELKYIHNVYHAYKVLFWNYVYETTGNHRKMFNLYSAVTGNTNEMAQVAADGKLGYGGGCFTKDVFALDHTFPHILTLFMRYYNGRLRKDT